MNKLKCEEISCKHNCQKLCKKQSIVLDEDAICCSYQRANESTFKNEFASENLPENSDIETSINCNEETCLFNDKCLCKAHEVTIDSEAWCSTYRRK